MPGKNTSAAGTATLQLLPASAAAATIAIAAAAADAAAATAAAIAFGIHKINDLYDITVLADFFLLPRFCKFNSNGLFL